MPLHADLYLDRIDLARYASGETCQVCHVDSMDELVERLRAGRVCAGACRHWTPQRLDAFRAAVTAEEYLPRIPSLDVPRPAEVGLFDLNDPDPRSPLIITGNSMLTHEVLLAVLSTSTAPMWMLSVDTGGHTVDMSMVYETLTPRAVADAIRKARSDADTAERGTNLSDDFSGRIILPGLAATIAEPLSATLDGPVEAGPICAAELPLFFGDAWMR